MASNFHKLVQTKWVYFDLTWSYEDIKDKQKIRNETENSDNDGKLLKGLAKLDGSPVAKGGVVLEESDVGEDPQVCQQLGGGHPQL